MRHKVGRAFSVSVAAHAKAALVLAGNGVYDGSECTEVVAALVHLSRAGVDVSCCASHHVITPPLPAEPPPPPWPLRAAPFSSSFQPTQDWYYHGHT